LNGIAPHDSDGDKHPPALEETRNPSTVPPSSVARAKFEISPFRTTVRA
jgi:hypothetical protein